MLSLLGVGGPCSIKGSPCKLFSRCSPGSLQVSLRGYDPLGIPISLRGLKTQEGVN